MFVDKLSDILKQKELKGELYSSEGLGWLRLLLQLVDVTKSGAEEHLMEFFPKGKSSQVLKAHRAQLTKDVCYTCMCNCMFRPCTLLNVFFSVDN